MQRVLADANLGEAPEKTVAEALRSLAELYMTSPGLHRVLAIEGLRVAKAEHVHAFDLRVIDLVRHFLSATDAPIARRNLEAAAFIVYQSVRATMLAYLLERPPGLDAKGLTEELADLVTGYLLRGRGSERKRSKSGRR
jgi:hypothetical protein